MITDIFFGLINLLIGLIPDITFAGSLTAGLASVADLFAYVDNFVPISAIVTCVSITLIVDNISFVVKVFNFIIRKIPGIS